MVKLIKIHFSLDRKLVILFNHYYCFYQGYFFFFLSANSSRILELLVFRSALAQLPVKSFNIIDHSPRTIVLCQIRSSKLVYLLEMQFYSCLIYLIKYSVIPCLYPLLFLRISVTYTKLFSTVSHLPSIIISAF